jgi:hypothetical protein
MGGKGRPLAGCLNIQVHCYGIGVKPVMDSEKKAVGPALYGSIRKAVGYMPPAKGQKFPEEHPLFGFCIIQGHLGHAVTLKIAEHRLQVILIILDNKGFPFFYTVGPHPSRKGIPIRPLYA